MKRKEITKAEIPCTKCHVPKSHRELDRINRLKKGDLHSQWYTKRGELKHLVAVELQCFDDAIAVLETSVHNFSKAMSLLNEGISRTRRELWKVGEAVDRVINEATTASLHKRAYKRKNKIQAQ